MAGRGENGEGGGPAELIALDSAQEEDAPNGADDTGLNELVGDEQFGLAQREWRRRVPSSAVSPHRLARLGHHPFTVRTGVRIPVGTPATKYSEVAVIKQATSEAVPSGNAPSADGAYINYAPEANSSAPTGEILQNRPGGCLPHFPIDGVAKLRSDPAAIYPVQNRSGSWSYRVTVTIAGVQRKLVFQSKTEAEELQEAWEHERVHGAAATRPKMTSMEKAELSPETASRPHCSYPTLRFVGIFARQVLVAWL